MKILAIDAMNIFHRAFYGIAQLNAPDGTPTNALYGFVNMTERLLKEFKPDAYAVMTDTQAPTFRHELCDTYKGTRSEPPEELRLQFPLLDEYLELAGIKTFRAAGWEADDLLGTAARLANERGHTFLIASGDRDAFQLINADTFVLYPSKGEILVTDEDAVAEKYGGLKPKQLIDVKALMGDSSDNIPGVRGVGEVTAVALIKLFGSLNGVYENLSDPAIKKGVRLKLEAGRESAYLSRKLGEIDLHAPIDPDFSALAPAPALPELKAFFTRLGLRKFAAAIDASAVPAAPAEPEPDFSSLFAGFEVIPPDAESFPDSPAPKVGENVKKLTPFVSNIAFDTALAEWLLGYSEPDPEPDTLKRAGKLKHKLEETGMSRVMYEIEMPLCRTLADMERRGFKVDVPALKEFSARLDALAREAGRGAYELAGFEFNMLSPKQVGETLFEKLRLPAPKKSGTDAETLKALNHPLADKILEYRELTKLKSTYADALVKLADAEDKIHTTFIMTGTATGRLSSAEPNLQNIPIRRALGSEIRKMFIPSRPDWTLADADYSQIELRVLAHMAGDENMRAAFAEGADFHAETAARVFGTIPGMVTPELRRRAKAVNFGVVYGISAFSLSRDIGVSVSEAKRYIDDWFACFRKVREFLDETKRRAEADGYVTTLFGRRRYLPGIKSPNRNVRSFWERAAINAPVQGTAADIIKLAMNAVARRLERENLEGRLILQVHDELIAECPERESERVSAILKEEMEGVFDLNPGLKADAGTGKTWYEAK